MPDLTAATVSRRIRAAGFARTCHSPTRVRGLKERTAGYSAHQAEPGRVRVDWVNDSVTRRDNALDALTRISCALKVAGLDVELYPTTPYLIVTLPGG